MAHSQRHQPTGDRASVPRFCTFSGGLDQPAGDCGADIHPEEAGKDLPAGGPVRDQPPAWGKGEERVGDDLAKHVDVGGACADDGGVRAAGRRLALPWSSPRPVTRCGALDAGGVRAEPDGGVYGRAADLDDQPPCQPGNREDGVAGGQRPRRGRAGRGRLAACRSAARPGRPGRSGRWRPGRERSGGSRRTPRAGSGRRTRPSRQKPRSPEWYQPSTIAWEVRSGRL